MVYSNKHRFRLTIALVTLVAVCAESSNPTGRSLREEKQDHKKPDQKADQEGEGSLGEFEDDKNGENAETVEQKKKLEEPEELERIEDSDRMGGEEDKNGENAETVEQKKKLEEPEELERIEESGGMGGEEGEGEAEGEQIEEEEEITPVDLDAACLLLGSVSFVTMLFQLVNFQDDDIRRYAWKVISNTISIFMAVLFFQGNNQIIVLWLKMAGLSEWLVVTVHYLHCLIYIIVMIATIGFISGVFEPAEFGQKLSEETWTYADAMLVNFGEAVEDDKAKTVRAVQDKRSDARKSVVEDKYGLEVAVVKMRLAYETRMRQNKGWSILLAHMGGFAAISAGGEMQQHEVFRKSPVLCFIPVVITTVLLLGAFQMTGIFRARLKAEGKLNNRPGVRAEMVTEICGDAENDILSLAMSFNTVQVVRYAITGILPNEEGLEEPLEMLQEFIQWRHVYAIWGCGFIFVLASVALARFRAKLSERPHGHDHTNGGHENKEEEHGSLAERLVDVLMTATAMSFAWCTLWGTRWAFAMRPIFGLSIASVDGRIMMALVLSCFSFLLVFVLDTVDDNLRASSSSEGGRKVAAKVIFAVISAISVLVGFSWEHSFDGAVTTISGLNKSHPAFTKFVMGICVFTLLVRPWRRHILKRALQLEKLKDDRETVKAEKGAGIQRPLLIPS